MTLLGVIAALAAGAIYTGARTYADAARTRSAIEQAAYAMERSVRLIQAAPGSGGTADIKVAGDSSIVFKGGQRVAAQEDRNLLMTLGFDVYGQAPEVTIAQLEAQHVDLSRIREDTWQGAKVWVVGAAKGDTTSNQFWIEKDRLLFVRLIESRKSIKNPDAPPRLLDVTFEGYQPLGKGWIETEVVIKVDGKEVQRERYADIKADVELPPDLYDTKTYRKPGWIKGQ